MHYDDTISRIGGFWLMFVLVLYLYVIVKLLRMRSRCLQGRISFRRYRAYRERIWRVLAKQTAIATGLTALIWGFTLFGKLVFG